VILDHVSDRLLVPTVTMLPKICDLVGGQESISDEV
jgi:hypothetical protein